MQTGVWHQVKNDSITWEILKMHPHTWKEQASCGQRPLQWKQKLKAHLQTSVYENFITFLYWKTSLNTVAQIFRFIWFLSVQISEKIWRHNTSLFRIGSSLSSADHRSGNNMTSADTSRIEIVLQTLLISSFMKLLQVFF